jgi:hypothetical protein
MRSRPIALALALATTTLFVLTAAAVLSARAVDQDGADGPALTSTDGITQLSVEQELQDLADDEKQNVGLDEASLAQPADVTFGQAAGSNVYQGTSPANSPILDFFRTLGLVVFTTPFNTHDGYGDGPFDPTEQPPLEFGHRPTLQGNGLSLRVNGLDSQSCNECHGIVSHQPAPPELGIGGVGGLVTNDIIVPSLIDVADSFDDRVSYVAGHDPNLSLTFDGVADFNGRFANPPFLFGGGGVELVAKEMTYDLQQHLATAVAAPSGTIVQLDTHGVNFGYLQSQGGGQVDLHPEGIGPEDLTGVPPEDVLVVRPFGRKGENFSMRDFDRGAMQFHFGLQPEEVVGNLDEDRDGHTNEVTVAEMTLLHLFSVTNPRPVTDPATFPAQRGKATFSAIGCADCHVPSIDTRTKWLPLSHPEVAHDPAANAFIYLNMKHFGFPVAGSGVRVPMYSDLKRHDMGPGLAETFERGEVANEEFITARLWGIADTAPYLHDGRATTLREAIVLHGGDAATAAANFAALSAIDQEELLEFLLTLRTPTAPNQDIVP